MKAKVFFICAYRNGVMVMDCLRFMIDTPEKFALSQAGNTLCIDTLTGDCQMGAWLGSVWLVHQDMLFSMTCCLTR